MQQFGDDSQPPPVAGPPAPAGTGLNGQMDAAAGTVAPAAAAPTPGNHGMTITHMGQSYTLPNLQEQHMAALGREAESDAAKYKNEVGLTGQLPTVDLVQKFGLDPKTKYRIGDLHAMAQIADYQAQAEERAAKANQPEKQPDLNFNTQVNEQTGDATTTGRNPITGKVISNDVQKGVGKKKLEPVPVAPPSPAAQAMPSSDANAGDAYARACPAR